MVFELMSFDGKALPSFIPGSHIDVFLPGGLVRQYSLCNGPEETNCYRIAVKLEADSRGGSKAMHESCRQGDTMSVGWPRNNFALEPTASFHLLLAGGIGITPLLSMARHLSATTGAFELHYFCRSAEHAAFRETLSVPPLSHNTNFHFGLDAKATGAQVVEILSSARPDTHLYVCGPIPFMDMVQDIAACRWTKDRIHLEHFKAPAANAPVENTLFEVKLARSGGTYVVPADRTIAQVLADNGIDVFTSCELGVCGTCIVTVLSGDPDHRDVYLTETEKSAGRKIALCISRARSAVLVLDL